MVPRGDRLAPEHTETATGRKPAGDRSQAGRLIEEEKAEEKIYWRAKTRERLQTCKLDSACISVRQSEVCHFRGFPAAIKRDNASTTHQSTQKMVVVVVVAIFSSRSRHTTRNNASASHHCDLAPVFKE